MVDLRHSSAPQMFDLVLHLGDPPTRLIQASDFLLHLLRRVGTCPALRESHAMTPAP